MRNRFAIAALAATVLALPAQSARADVGSGSGCGGALYTMCAAWSLAFDAGTGIYTLSVTNSSNAPVEDGEIKEIGLGNATAGSFTITKVGDWGVWDLGNVQGNPFSGMGMINLVLLAGTTGNNTLATGSSVVLQFTSSGALDIEQIGFHEISGPNSCSTKSVFALTGTGQTGTPLGEGSEACGSTTIPEPSTVVLLGTGIVGILAARRRRRTTES